MTVDVGAIPPGRTVMRAPAAEGAVPLWHGIGDVPTGFGPCVVTLGVFDGLHRGHARLVERALQVGAARGLPTVLATFDPHPARVLGLPRDTAQLCTVERRAELAHRLGIEATCVLPFTPEFAELRPDEFVEQVVVAGLHAQAVVVGANFTFGRRGAGTAGTLRELGIRHGFTTYSVSLVHEVETRCSSTAVRECLRRGDIHCAARVLGRPHRVEGTLQPAGAAMSELRTAPGTALPGPGRYLGRLGGAGSVAVSVTGEARLLVEYPSMRPSWGSVEFTGDSQGLVAVFERA